MAAALDTRLPAACCKRIRVGSTDDYEKSACLGLGSFGVVAKARHRGTRKTVAIKFLHAAAEARPPDIGDLLREARLLDACAAGNPHLVGFRGMVRDPASGALCGLVMDYVGPSLDAFLWQRRSLPEPTVRAFMRQLLAGAQKMHGRGVVHRDIKPANVLVADGGALLKICDLGLAISVADPPPYDQAGTITYMAPEMLLGKTDYGAQVDAWSLGCVMAELITGSTLFPAGDDTDDEVRQLRTIFSVLGMPDSRTWPGFADLPAAADVPCPPLEGRSSRLGDLFPDDVLSEDGFDVLEGLLTCNPDRRLSAAAALQHPWFAHPHTAAAANAKVDAAVWLRKIVPPLYQ